MGEFEMEVVKTDKLESHGSSTDGEGELDGTTDDVRTDTDRVDSEEKVSIRFEGLPDGWGVHKLQHVTEVVGGSTPSTKNDEYWGGEIPWATPTDVTGLRGATITETEDKITEEGLNSASTHILPEYSVLMTSRATIGACAVNTVPMATNQGFQSLVPGEKLNTWYLFYRMLNEAPYLESLGAGSTFSEVSKRVVEKIDIPVPPHSEQRKIASVLYAVDQAIQKTEAIIEQVQRVKRGLMQDLFANGWKKASARTTWFGHVPNYWSVERLGQLADVTKLAGYEYTDKFEYDESGDVKALRAINLKGNRLNLNNEVRHITRGNSDRLSRSKLSEGDVAMTYVGAYIGEVGYIPDSNKYHLGPNVAKISPNEKILGRYLHQLLQTRQLSSQIKARQSTTGQPALSMAKIRKLEIPFPNTLEQKRIVEVLTELDDYCMSEGVRADELQRLKKGLMQDLLTGEVRTANTALEVLDEVAAHG